MLRMLQTAVLMTFSALSVAAAVKIPDELKVPEGEKLLLRAHATGFQIYTCKSDGAAAPQWELKAPDADLHDRKGAVIGHHFAGPTWKHKDGSEVTGKANAHVDSPDANSIPWLRVAATGIREKGCLRRCPPFSVSTPKAARRLRRVSARLRAAARSRRAATRRIIIFTSRPSSRRRAWQAAGRQGARSPRRRRG